MFDRLLEINRQIADLQHKLDKIDYKTDKYVEGELSEEEFAEVKAQKKAWRAEINALEAESIALRKQYYEDKKA